MPSRIGGRLLSASEKGSPTVLGGKTYYPVAKYPSSSDPTTEYTVCEVDDGTLSCDCKGWTRRNPPTGRTCRHTQDFDNFLRHDQGTNQVEEFFDSAAEAVAASTPKKPVEGGSLSDLFEKLDKGGL